MGCWCPLCSLVPAGGSFDASWIPGFLFLSGTAAVRCRAPPSSRLTICPRHHLGTPSDCLMCISGVLKPSSFLLRGHTRWCPQTGCRAQSPDVGICSALSATAERAPERPWVWEPAWSWHWRALQLHHPLGLGHDVEDLLSASPSSSLSGGSLWSPKPGCGERSPAAGICSASALAGFAPEQHWVQEPTGKCHLRALEQHHPWECDRDLEDYFSSSSSSSSSSLLSGRSLWCPPTSCGHLFPTAGICSGPSPWHHSSGSGKKG